MRTLIALALIASTSVAYAADVSTINPYRHLDDSAAEIAAAHPELDSIELALLIFRIADAGSVRSLHGGALTASEVNPFGRSEQAREQLAVAFPSMTDIQLDRLMFRIADARSIDMLGADLTMVAAAK